MQRHACRALTIACVFKCRARHAREAKFANQDAKRRKMREKLEREEAAVFSGRNEEAEARSRLQVCV